MKRTISLFVVLILALLPLACQNRALTQPIDPSFAAAPTPTPAYGYNNNIAATPTATP